MDEFKIDLFEQGNQIEFPHFNSLSESECDEIAKTISKMYKIAKEDIVNELMLRQSFYEGSDATSTDFRLIQTLDDLKITPLKNIYINWFKFDKVDLFRLEDVDRYFDDIWFPSADDIDLFDDTLNWILSIRHDGCLSFIKQN